MARIIYNGKIEGNFEGYNDNVIFKMADGTYWMQSEYKYWYHYEYGPDAVITEERGVFILTVAGESVSIKQLRDVVESTINGTFDGWKGGSTYKLTNGQVWQQCRYRYDYKNAYRPQVVVGNMNGEYMMFVEGTYAIVRRV